MLTRFSAALLALTVFLAPITTATETSSAASPRSSAGFAWPYPTNFMPKAIKQPWQCGLPSMLDRSEVCLHWRQYQAGFYALSYGGPDGVAAAQSLLATGMAAGDAAALSDQLYSSRYRCNYAMRTNTARLWNELYARGQLTGKTNILFRGAGIYGKVYWYTAKTVNTQAVKLGKALHARGVSSKIAAAAWDAGC